MVPIKDHKPVPVRVENGLIKCGANGGNLRVAQKTSGGDPLKITWRWVGDPQGQLFQLQFFAIPMEEDSPPTNPCWPFVGSPPPNCLTQPATHHEYIVRQDTLIACKYSVLVDDLHLDPIIIVEK